jgi:hypothetical protein
MCSISASYSGGSEFKSLPGTDHPERFSDVPQLFWQYARIIPQIKSWLILSFSANRSQIIPALEAT